MSTDLLDTIDDWGPEKVVTISDRRLGYSGVLVIDNTARGMGKGGTRMSATVSATEVARLARTMTWKWAAIDVLLGGAKAGIRADPSAPGKEEILRSFARKLHNEIPTEYVFGLDMGLTENDAAIIVDELGIGTAMGTPTSLGGVAYDQLGITGYGVAEATQAATDHLGHTVQDSTVSIHGFGAVGQAAAIRLQEMGARITHIATRYGTVIDTGGFDVERLVALAGVHGEQFVSHADGPSRPADEALTADVDILIPAAIHDVITSNNVDAVRARLLVEGANLPTSPGAAEVLRQRGVTIVPDFIANAGGALAAAHAMDARTSVFTPDTDGIFVDTSQRIRRNVAVVLDRASTLDIDTKQAARDLAQERVRDAMIARGRIRQ